MKKSDLVYSTKSHAKDVIPHLTAFLHYSAVSTENMLSDVTSWLLSTQGR